ncbi:MAG: polysaccharide biosynthesis protein [Candidatus Heimdallarchaeota archaeon]|nr:polysaccharide biosynthesis protein [Candidatus Heimdallarchaeota archaeon]
MIEDKIWECIQDKVILITGGTGFLGKTLATRFLKYEPQSIRIFSRDEVKHFRFNNIFGANPLIRNLIGDVRDYDRIIRASEDADVLIHAAALKRIDIIEYNVTESVKTNVLGTLNVARAALRNNISKALFISTDKACYPLNSYGACKLLGERIFTEMNYSKGKSKTILSSVRYGNVLASTGSIIPFFKQKIQDGEPIPLTHPEMTRFIVSAEQAVDLVMKACVHSVGGEVIVPVLPAVKIVDLIESIKILLNAESEIINVGIRPGEKIHEILINEYEVPQTYKFEDLYIISSLIEKYQKEIDRPIYQTKGEKMMKTTMKEYSSKENLISQGKLLEYLKSLNIL